MPMRAQQRVSTLPAGVELANGTIDNASLVGRTSTNDAVGAAYETVWNQGGIKPDISYGSPVTMDIVSSSTNDTNSGGSGAKRVKIRGIIGDGSYVEEQVNLNGTATVTSTNTFVWMDKMTVSKGATNDGTITMTATGGSDVHGKIPAGDGESMVGGWYAPTGENAHLTSFFVGCVNECKVSIWARRANVNGPWAKKLEVFFTNITQPYILPNPIMLEAGQELQFRAIRTDSTDAKVSVDFQIIREA